MPAAGNPPTPNAAAHTSSVAPLTITLVTGDKVIARQGPSGAFATDVRPGPGRAGMAFHKIAFGKQQSVVPLDAMPLVAAGIVDARLFDIALLADLGLDDASAPRLPLLIQYSGTPRAVRSALPEGTEVKRELPLVDAVAISQERAQAGQLWSSWSNAKRRTGLTGTVKKVWLDGGITPNLDRSIPQIGAPAAWQIGATGKGVKVAVLDSGYDAGHPDLKDHVIASKGFTADDESDVVDRIGHGTHVASTVAGNGAASGGKYRGVAPDADLLIGKVCGFRNCELSDMIAGMQWAAEQGARVVNMSLGGGPTDGTDVVAQAVNELTASTGTLFVASAGNFGVASSIGSPASADSALAVASVTKSDTMSSFSSQGPRIGDLAVKPDISAPGSRIVAARAADTPLDPFAVNTSYAELSGTSMAAPHVTGAAALLAQLHPDWKAPQLKSALMGSALGLTNTGIFAQGAGRVDLAHAIKQPVLAFPSSLNLGLQPSPHDDDKPVTKPVTYTNDSATAVKLKLAIQGPKLFKLSRSSITVPAKGSATVDVTATTSGPEPDGAYAGWLVATGNGMTIRTTVGIGKELATSEQTLVMLDRTGAPAANDENNLAGAYLLDLDRLQLYSVAAGENIRLPHGRYLVDAYAAKFNPGGMGFADVTYFGEPDLVIGNAGKIVLDGRNANKIAVKAPVTGADAAAGGVGFARPVGKETYIGGVGIANSFLPDYSPDLYVVPNKTGSAKNFTGFAHLAWAGMPDGQSPEGDFYLDSPYLYHDVATWPGRFPANPSLITDPRDYAHLDASYAGEPGNRANNYGYPTLPKPDANGRWVGLFMFTPSVEMNLPFRRDEYYSTKNVSWAFENDLFRRLPNRDIEYTALVDSQHVAYPPGTTKIEWQRGVFGPSQPDSRGGMPGRDPIPWSFRDGDSLTIVALMYGDGGAGRFGDALVDSEHTTLSRDGIEIGSSDSAKQQTFAVPADEATYQLAKVVKRSDERFKLSTEISSRWTFKSRRTADGVETALPLLNVRYTPTLDDRNRAPGGKFGIPVTVEPAFRAPARPIVSLTVSASFDDGKTWRQLPVRRTGAGWMAMVDQPSSGFVALRASAVDAVGNKVDQTIHRAYELR